MAYHDPLEIIEALGFDPAFGEREWLGELHVSDLGELALALCLAQSSPVIWDELEPASVFFGEVYDRWAGVLDIEAPERGEPVEVHPTYLSWAPSPAYVAERLGRVFLDALAGHPEPLRVTQVEWEGELQVRLFVDLDGFSRSRRITIARIPCRGRYASHRDVRADMLRYAVEGVTRYQMSTDAWFPSSGRALYRNVIARVETIWGLDREADLLVVE